jgi:hypothetical protein
MVSEIHTKQSNNEENSSLFMKSILLEGKNEEIMIMHRNLNETVLS